MASLRRVANATAVDRGSVEIGIRAAGGSPFFVPEVYTGPSGKVHAFRAVGIGSSTGIRVIGDSTPEKV